MPALAQQQTDKKTFTPVSEKQDDSIQEAIEFSSSWKPVNGKAASSGGGADPNSSQPDSRSSLTSSHNFGNISLLPVSPVNLQPNVTVNEPDDKYEREADAVAEKIMKRSYNDNIHSRFSSVNIVQRKHAEVGNEKGGKEKKSDHATETVQPSVINRLRPSGEYLDTPTRLFMESRFGYDFSNIKIHNDPEANQSAKDLNAWAYTHQNDIVFAAGFYQPRTDTGKKLLAHELTHVLQQNKEPLTNRIQKKGPHQTKKEPVQNDEYHFWITVPRVMTREEWIDYIENWIFRKRMNMKWNGTGIDDDKLITEKDVGKRIDVHLDKTAYQQALGIAQKPDEPMEVYVYGEKKQKQVDEEVERRFSSSTAGASVTASGGKADWSDSLRADIRRELNKQIEYLGEQAPLFSKIVDYSAYGMEDYDKLVVIYRKLATLTPAELEEYLNKVNYQTRDLSVIEKAIDNFILEKKNQKENRTRREILKTKLLGLDATFDLYYRYKIAMRVTTNQIGQGMGALGNIGGSDPSLSMPSAPIMDVQKAEKDLLENLKANGFKGIAEFEELVDNYEKEFLIRAKEVAFDLLARYQHKLFEAQQKYSDPAVSSEIFKQLQPIRQIKRLQSEYRSLRDEADIQRFNDPGYSQRKSDEAEEKRREGEAILPQAQAAKTKILEDYPLLAANDFKRDPLVAAPDEAAIRQIIQTYIAGRQADIEKTRANITKNPLLLYKLDIVMDQVYKIENLSKNSIYAKIIRFKNEERKFDDAEIKAALLVFTLALTIATFGGGAIAVVAGGASFAISAYQALEELKKYNVEAAAYGAKLLSEEPSLGWVIVAFVGAGIDLATFSVATFKLIAGAAKDLKVATDTEKALGKFKDALDQIPGVNEKLKQALIRSARSEAKLSEAAADYDRALLEFRKLGGRVYSGIDPELVYRFFKLAYARLRKGAISFQAFTDELKVTGALKGTETGAELRALKQGFIEALEEESRLAKIQKIGERLPINAEDFAGKTFSFDLTQNPVLKERILAEKSPAVRAVKQAELADLAKKYPNGVKFTEKGFPDFKPYAVKLQNGKSSIVKVKTAGNRAADFAEADRLAGITEQMRKTNEWVWHHAEDMETMILIPRDVHGTVKHSGGISVYANSLDAEEL